jgi:uncharacterized membrane protein YphA (DoxX/SURF4 family)
LSFRQVRLVYCRRARSKSTYETGAIRKSMRPIEKWDVQMIRTTHTWKRWLLVGVMISWIYLASSLLQSASSEVLKFTLLCGVLAITEVLIGISIAAGEVFPFALGLVFFGTLLSYIPFFHLHSFNFPPDHWKLAVALAACAVLINSRWINQVAEHLALPHGFKTTKVETSDSIPDPPDQKVEITVRMARREFAILPRRRCIVSIRHPRKSAPIVKEALENTSAGGIWKHQDRDHKLPFWVR